MLLKDLQALGGKRGGGGKDDPEIEEDDGVGLPADITAPFFADKSRIELILQDDNWDDDDPLGDAGEDEFQYLSCELACNFSRNYRANQDSLAGWRWWRYRYARR